MMMKEIMYVIIGQSLNLESMKDKHKLFFAKIKDKLNKSINILNI